MDNNYRFILLHELEKRALKNPRYSMRAFARDIGISAPRLSDILKQRYGLSKSAALSIAGKLGFNQKETTYFCDLVESQHGRSDAIRKKALERAQSNIKNYSQLSIDQFQVIADWYHYGILELSKTRDFQSNEEWISKRLEITPVLAHAAIERLIRLKLLGRSDKGILTAINQYVAGPDGIPSEAVRAFHTQIMEKAKNSIQKQSVQERDLSSLVLAFDPKKLDEARAMIKDFRRKFAATFGTTGECENVYCISVQFFNLEKP